VSSEPPISVLNERSEPPFSILNEDGSCSDAHAALCRELVSDEELPTLLELILLNRLLDKRLLALQRQGRLGFWMTSTGEEATIFAAAMCLNDDDPIFLTYRELGCLLWRRIPLPMIFNQLIGNSQDRMHGRQMPVHYCYPEFGIPSVSSPTGTQLPHACGFAYAAKLRGTGQTALAFLGEGTASQGDFHTALNFSGVFEVPAVYLIRNNGYAISTPESAQTAAESLAIRAEGYGIPGFQVDGNDLFATANVLQQAVERARRGDGPTLIEAMTYRMGAHSSADDPSAYRPDEEAEAWRRTDPYERLKRHAVWRGCWSDEVEEAMHPVLDQRIVAAISECERHPPPQLETLFEDVLHRMSPQLAEQRERYLNFYRHQRVDQLPEIP
jgi:pyruvate dehydrogenase E1 component alpha subunit